MGYACANGAYPSQHPRTLDLLVKNERPHRLREAGYGRVPIRSCWYSSIQEDEKQLESPTHTELSKLYLWRDVKHNTWFLLFFTAASRRLFNDKDARRNFEKRA